MDEAKDELEPQADGYYGDEELEDGELDLSFLDDEEDEAPKTQG